MGEKLTEKERQQLGKQLIIDELFDLMLYRRYVKRSSDSFRDLLIELTRVEEYHYHYWQEFFGVTYDHLPPFKKIKLFILDETARVFGEPAMHLILDAIEIYGIKKYLRVWDVYHDSELGKAVERILTDELKHEELLVTRGAEQGVSGERIRNIFLGFNDGIVEMLGAVSGFFAALNVRESVILASITVAVAGAISMAAGIFAASGSEREIENMELRRRAFLGEKTRGKEKSELPYGSALVVGISYFIGALVPILPVIAGSKSVFTSIIVAGIFIILLSSILAFLTGMSTGRRIRINLVVIALAVGVTYIIGYALKSAIGIELP